jgi:hypothetical protein
MVRMSQQSWSPPVTLPSGFPPDGAQIGNQIRQPLCPQPNVSAVRADIHPLHEQLHDARLLGGEQLIPHRIEPV